MTIPSDTPNFIFLGARLATSTTSRPGACGTTVRGDTAPTVEHLRVHKIPQARLSTDEYRRYVAWAYAHWMVEIRCAPAPVAKKKKKKKKKKGKKGRKGRRVA